MANSYRDLERLGTGTLCIDAKAGSCRFEGVSIEPPNIAGELHAWLCADLAAHGIPISGLLRASLAAQLSITLVAARPRVTSVQFLRVDGKPIRTGKFYRCEIACESEVATEDAVYRSRHTDLEEWPAGWPDA